MARRNLTRPALALALSLLGHALAVQLLLAHAGPPATPSPAPVTPTFLEIRTAAPTRIPAAPQVPSRPAARAPLRALAPHARTLPLPIDLGAPAQSALEAPSSTEAGGGLPLPGGDGVEVEAAVATGRASTPAAGTADVLAEIQALLAARASGCYPKAAARLGLTGTAEVRFCVGGDGSARDVSLRHGSGEALLDRAALRCVVGEAGPLPALPECLVVPVEFRRP